MSTYRELAIMFQAYLEAIDQAKSDIAPHSASQFRLELEDDDIPLVVRALRIAALDPAAVVASFAAETPEQGLLIEQVAQRLRDRIAGAVA